MKYDFHLQISHFKNNLDNYGILFSEMAVVSSWYRDITY